MAAEGIPGAKLHGQRILVVEDDRLVRESLGWVLQAHHVEVRLAADGASGVRAALDQAPDAVIMDVVMPVLDGISASRWLRSAGCTVPVVFLTGTPDALSPADLTDLAPVSVLHKPCSFEDLATALCGWLR